MTLDTQRLLAIEPGMIIMVSAFAGMATRAGHHLPGTGVKNIFANGVGKLTVLSMTFAADIIDRGLGHSRVV